MASSHEERNAHTQLEPSNFLAPCNLLNPRNPSNYRDRAIGSNQCVYVEFANDLSRWSWKLVIIRGVAILNGVLERDLSR